MCLVLMLLSARRLKSKIAVATALVSEVKPLVLADNAFMHEMDARRQISTFELAISLRHRKIMFNALLVLLLLRLLISLLVSSTKFKLCSEIMLA